MDADLWVYLVFIALVLLFSVVSNIVTVVCMAKFRKLRIVTNVFICNLAISDILLAGFYMPQRLHDLSHTTHYHEGEILCRVINFFPIFVITTSCYTLVCISFERYRAIVDFSKPPMTFSNQKKIIPAVWVFGFMVSLPSLLEFTVQEAPVVTSPVSATNNSTQYMEHCGNEHRSRTYVLINCFLVVVVSFIIPLILMFYNYTRIAVFVNRRCRQVGDIPQKRDVSKEIPKERSGDGMNLDEMPSGKLSGHSELGSTSQNMTGSKASSKTVVKSRLTSQRLHIVHMLIIVAVVFAVSWTPFFVIFIFTKITGNDASSDASSYLNLLLNSMATFSTAYNVVLYIIFNKNFKEAIKTLLHIQ